jgi:hypothetical protein
MLSAALEPSANICLRRGPRGSFNENLVVLHHPSPESRPRAKSGPTPARRRPHTAINSQRKPVLMVTSLTTHLLGIDAPPPHSCWSSSSLLRPLQPYNWARKSLGEEALSRPGEREVMVLLPLRLAWSHLGPGCQRQDVRGGWGKHKAQRPTTWRSVSSLSGLAR